MAFKRIAVLGLGKVGTLAATLLQEAGFDVTGVDMRRPSADLPFDVQQCDFSEPSEVKMALNGFEAILSCLPYNLNENLAQFACLKGQHYFDLTEDVLPTQPTQKFVHI